MRKAIVFVGPTLSPADLTILRIGATVLGPAACGDVLDACRERPPAIALIDGVFDHQLAVWHKEILWALAQGIPVYGAASMGALRAVELQEFGMIGVGRVFELFATGFLEDDDEVAIVHDDAEHGYKGRSEAMVNIRITLDSAVVAGVLSPDSRDTLISRTKANFYPDRSYQSLLSSPGGGVGEAQLRDLAAWLQAGHEVNQKRADALALLERLNSDLQGEPGRTTVFPAFTFEHTDAWEALRARRDLDGLQSGARELAAIRSAVATARAGGPEFFERIWATAIERAFCVWLGRASNVEADAVQSMVAEFRRARGLVTTELAEAWLADQGIEIDELSRLMYEEVLVRRFRDTVHDAGRAQLPGVLRLRG